MTSSLPDTLYREAAGDLRGQLGASHGVVRIESRSRALHAHPRCDGGLDAQIFALPTH